MVIKIGVNHVRHESWKVVFTLIELETGADSLTKPFEMKGLKVRIHHLLEVRKKLLKKFSRSLGLQTSEIAVYSINEKFLNRVLAILEENIGNTYFDVETFSREFGMSRTKTFIGSRRH